MLIFWLALAAVLATPATAAQPAPTPVQFTSLDAAQTQLSGLLLTPETPGPHAAIIMLHGCSGMLTKSGKLKKRPTFWSRWLAAKGYVVLLADSFTNRGLQSICRTKERPIHPDGERPFDAYGALRYLQGRPEVHPDRVALMGWSNGAMTLLWTVKSNARQRPSGLAHDFRAAIGFYPGCVQISRQPFETTIPTLLQLGGADDWTLPKPCLRMVERARAAGSPIEAVVHDNAYHNFDHPSSKVRTIVTRNSVYASGEKRVHTGTNIAARDAAVASVAAYLDRWLR